MSNRFIILWLDATRDPNDPKWLSYIVKKSKVTEDFRIIWLKSYKDFADYLEHEILPDFIFFDHDLGDTSEDEKTGYSCAKLLVEYYMNNKMPIPGFEIQSSNPAGADNIRGLLTNYKKFYYENYSK